MNVIESRLKELDALVIHHGSHKSFEKGHCALEVVAWLAGEKHSDKPACVCPVIAGFVRTWNDGISDDELRTRVIRPLLPKMLNTRVGGDEVLLRRMWLALDWQIRVYAPAFLRAAKLDEAANALAALPEIVDARTLKDTERSAFAADSAARSAADSAADSAARSAADSAARSAADSAARSAARSAADSAAAFAARSAARSAAYSAAASAAYSAAYSAADSAADSAAREALAPTVASLQASASELVLRMCAVGAEFERPAKKKRGGASSGLKNASK